MTFFDDVNKQLFGRTWVSPGAALPEADHEGFHLPLNADGWFHTRINDPDCYALVELFVQRIAAAAEERGSSSHEDVFRSRDDETSLGSDGTAGDARTRLPGPRVAVGWTVLQCFPADGASGLPAYRPPRTRRERRSVDDQDAGMETRRLYPGTPRCVFLAGTMEEALADAAKSAAVHVGLLRLGLYAHDSMPALKKLVPENVLVGSNSRVPGLPPPASADGQAWLATLTPPQTASYIVGNVSLAFDPVLHEWEALLSDHLNQNAREQHGATAAMGGMAPVRIVQRMLRVGVHNGLKFIHEPTEVLLAVKDGQAEPHAADSSGSRLVFDGSVTLSDVPMEGDVAVVLELVYIVALPVIVATDNTKKGRELKKQVGRAGAVGRAGKGRAQGCPVCPFAPPPLFFWWVNLAPVFFVHSPVTPLFSPFPRCQRDSPRRCFPQRRRSASRCCGERRCRLPPDGRTGRPWPCTTYSCSAASSRRSIQSATSSTATLPRQPTTACG